MKPVFPGICLLVAMAAAGAGAMAQVAAMSGVVRDAQGTPQMGALVQLLAADASVAATALTDDHGRYLLSPLVPGRYSVRATAAFLMPLNRAGLRLQAGSQAVVNLTMNTLFDAEGWLPTERRRAGEPADDWKWALRSTANRPLLRMVNPQGTVVRVSEVSGISGVSSSASENLRASSQARLSVTSGDGAFGQGGLHQVLLLNHTVEGGDSAILRVDVGNQPAGLAVRPSMEASAGYERRSPLGGSTRMVASYQTHPETVYGAGAGFTVLRLASTEQLRLGDAVEVDAGTLLAAERLEASRVESQPFVRLSVKPAADMVVEYRFATGRALQASGDLDRLQPETNLLTDSLGKPLSAKGSHHELMVSRKMGSRSVSGSVYRDSFDHAELAGSGLADRGTLLQTAMLADPTTAAFRLAGAGYSGSGASGMLVQELTPVLDLTMEYDLGTALRAQLGPPEMLDAAVASAAARTAQAASAAVRGKVLRSGTSLQAEYRWQPVRTLTQVNAYNVAPGEAFLGFTIRQRVRCGRLLPSGLDAVVQATNLLEQGYQPVLGADGRTLYLAQVPRAVMGGLAFNF